MSDRHRLLSRWDDNHVNGISRQFIRKFGSDGKAALFRDDLLRIREAVFVIWRIGF